MATRVWQSSDGNWGNTASWTGAAVPVSNDIVIFPENNAVSVTSGLSQAAVDLDALITKPGYIGNIGSSGTHLSISADRVLHEGSGTLYYTDGDGTTDLVIVNALGNVAAAVFSGTALSRIVLLAGKTTLDASLAALTDLEIGFVNSPQSDAECVIENGAGTITNLLMSGGVVSSSAVITNAHLNAGILTQESVAGAITNLFLAGGICRYKTSTTLVLAQLLAGVLDCREARSLTISTLRVHPGARALVPEDMVTVTAGGALLGRVEYGDS